MWDWQEDGKQSWYSSPARNTQEQQCQQPHVQAGIPKGEGESSLPSMRLPRLTLQPTAVLYGLLLGSQGNEVPPAVISLSQLRVQTESSEASWSVKAKGEEIFSCRGEEAVGAQ